MSCELRFLADKDAPRSPGVRRESSASVNMPLLPRLLRTAKAQHLVIPASILNEADVSPRDERNYISRRDAGTRSSKQILSCSSLRLGVSARAHFGCG